MTCICLEISLTIAQPIKRDLHFIEKEFERQEMKLDEKLTKSLLSVRQSYNEMRQKNVNLEQRIRELTENKRVKAYRWMFHTEQTFTNQH